MKVCLVLISGGWGGAENVVYNMAMRLQKKVNLVMLLDSEMVRYFENLDNIKIFQINSLYDTKSLISSILLKRAKHGQKSGWSSGFPFYLFNDLLRHVYCKRVNKDILQMLIQEKVDIVHLHNPWSLGLLLPLSKKLDTPMVFTVHDGRIVDPSLPFERALIMKGLARVNKITCVSEYVGRVCENFFPTSGKPAVIYNGVDVDEIRKSSGSYTSGNDFPKMRLGAEFRLLFSGGAKSWKGGDLLIESLTSIKAEIPKVHLYIAGAVPKKHALRRLVKERKLEKYITFLGFLWPQKYFQVLSSMDMLVSASKAEAFGLIYLEAMALGKPIVAVKVGAVPELVKDMQNGILVDRDPDSIAEAVVHLYKNKDLYEEISQNNLETVRSFNWNSVINKYVALYETLLN